MYYIKKKDTLLTPRKAFSNEFCHTTSRQTIKAVTQKLHSRRFANMMQMLLTQLPRLDDGGTCNLVTSHKQNKTWKDTIARNRSFSHMGLMDQLEK